MTEEVKKGKEMKDDGGVEEMRGEELRGKDRGNKTEEDRKGGNKI